MVDLELWKLDGEAGGDEDDNERDEHYDENDDSSENIAMKYNSCRGTHRYYLSLSLSL